jgi:hypothetical protein
MYIVVRLTKKYTLSRKIKNRPVQGRDDLFRSLYTHWAIDSSVFSNERQRLQLPAIQLFAAYTTWRPDELVESAGGKQLAKNYGQQSLPWENPEDPDYQDVDENLESSCDKRTRVLCYEDIFLVMIGDPNGKRAKFAMEVTLSHHKGYNKKPHP